MTTPTYPILKYPNYLTPHGEYHLFAGRIPEVTLTSPDGTAEFYLMGGRSITDHIKPESVKIKDISKLVPGWQMIDQKGATQDGVTFVTALYDPAEPEITVEARGRNPQYCRRVLHDLYASLDPIKTSKLAFFSYGEGYWWANVRWLSQPEDSLEKINVPRQIVTLKLRNDDGFWRTYDNTDIFALADFSSFEPFTTDYSGLQNLGANWPLRYSGAGSAYISTVTAILTGDIQARWYPSGTASRSVVVGPRIGFNTPADHQIIEMTLGQQAGLNRLFQQGSYNDIWGRMNRDGSNNWNGNGIRARIGVFGIFIFFRLSRFNNFVETVMREETSLIPPLPNDKFTLLCGDGTDTRQFRILRNGLTMLRHKEVGTGSQVGSTHRGIGFGMEAGAGDFAQVSPSWVKSINAGSNTITSKVSFLQRVNVGDQAMFDDYTLFGPGTFRIWDGPDADANEFVEFGPLLANQVVFLRAHPGKRTVHDLTSIPSTSQDFNIFQEAFDLFMSFAFGNNTPPLVKTILSIFGITPPQGNLYTLLKGRFSDNAAIPPKPSGKPAEPYYVKAEIINGNAESKIIAAGTPFRRYPL
jgi:hypothetical protein